MWPPVQSGIRFTNDINSNRVPFLKFHENAQVCFHGRYRLLAASEHLDPLEQWWIVELYVDGILYDYGESTLELAAADKKLKK